MRKKVKDCIFLYADIDSPISKDVPSISRPYKSISSFLLENEDFRIWARYSKDDLLKAWGVKKEIEDLNQKINELEKQNANYKKEMGNA